MEERPELSLLCRVGDLLCALPLEHVEETMRPMPVEAIAGLPSFVRGLAVVRGAPIPVVDAASLLSGDTSDATRATRFVTVKTGSRRIALMVDAAKRDFTQQCRLPEDEFFADSFTTQADLASPR